MYNQVLAAVVVASVSVSTSQVEPLAGSMFPDARILASCQLDNGGVAVAAANPGPGGVYYIIVPGSEPARLKEFTDEAGLACYSPEEARWLNGAIADSETISGGIFPSESGTVVCGFVSFVEAECWQFDLGGNIRHVGGWTT